MAEKTIFPGMAAPSAAPAAAPQAPANGTMYPGMAAPAPEQKSNNSGSKPIMGFLFSVSKTPYGEFWPLYVGPNTIGRGSSNAICLAESSVSDSHATIVIRKMQKQGSNNGIFVFVQDTGSMCGTLLNGDTLDFNPRECKSGDIITIGANYELLLIIVDPDALGLQPKPDFQATDKAAAAAAPSPAANSGWVGFQTAGQPKGTLAGGPGMGFGQMPAEPDPDSQRPSANPFDTRKATIYMPKK